MMNDGDGLGPAGVGKTAVPHKSIDAKEPGSPAPVCTPNLPVRHADDVIRAGECIILAWFEMCEYLAATLYLVAHCAIAQAQSPTHWSVDLSRATAMLLRLQKSSIQR
jgi:hypothetical protein